MNKITSLAVIALGLTDQANAYKVRKWADMFKKKPLSEELVTDLLRQYDVIYTLGHNALVEADNTDGFQVQERFGINLQDKVAEGTGLHKLASLKNFA